MIHFGTFTINILIVFYLLSLGLIFYWSRELTNKKYSLFIYFWISTWMIPIFTIYTDEGKDELVLPLGFIFVMFYLYMNRSQHPTKWRVTFLGLLIGIIKELYKYGVFN